MRQGLTPERVNKFSRLEAFSRSSHERLFGAWNLTPTLNFWHVGSLVRSSSAGTTSEGAGGEGGGPPGRGGSGGNPSGQEVSLSLVSLLTRLQLSLQSLSSAALTTAVAREQIHQVGSGLEPLFCSS